MSSIKCNQCGLVNFASEKHCKRCKNPITDLSPLANKRSYQSKIAEFQKPPPPAFYDYDKSQIRMENYCLKCGANGSLSIQTFTKKYVSPAAVLGIFIGIVPYFLFRLLLTTKHEISAPFCEDCWAKFKKSRLLLQISHLGIFLSILVGIFAAAFFESILFLFIVFGLGIAFWIYCVTTEHLKSPKYKKIDDKKVIIASPKLGEICFEK